MKKAGEDTAPIMAQMKTLSDKIKAIDAELKTVEEEYNTLMLGLYNLPDPDLKPGGKENNEPIRYYGDPHKFDFTPKNHVDLCTDLGLIDLSQGSKAFGNGFGIQGLGSRLEWALLNYFIDTHISDGYELVLVPHMLGYEAGLRQVSSPSLKTMFTGLPRLRTVTRRFMLPTAETALSAFTEMKFLKESELPRKYISYTPCFRREGPVATAPTKGAWSEVISLIRLKWFQYTLPEKSDEALRSL
jgi:seryl-tRNA synthetase